MERTANCLAKLERMNKTLHHREPDRVPVSDFFWGSLSNAGAGARPAPRHRHLLLRPRLEVVNPNMDPHIKPFEMLRNDESEVTVRTGFERRFAEKVRPGHAGLPRV